MNQKYKIVFTGGHHTSALVVARACKEKGYDVVWFGHRHSMWGDVSDSAEYLDVTAAKIEFHNLVAGKGYRTYNPYKLLRVPLGFFHAWHLLKKMKPDCIVSSGGYLAVPTVIIGYILGIPSLTHEQTVTTGWAAKIVEVFAKKIAVSWPESLKYHNPKKTTLTGLPLRPEIIKIKSGKKNENKKPVLYITGGKQGSHRINQEIFKIIPKLEKTFKIIHQTGTSTVVKDFEQSKKFHSDSYESFGYSSEKAILALTSSDMIICRSGAHMCYEIGYLGKKAILIPLAYASHNEQKENALVLQEAGLATIIEENDLSEKTIFQAINEIIGKSVQPLNLPEDATKSMVHLIEQICKDHVSQSTY